MNNKTYISLLLAFVSLVWAGSFVAVRMTVKEISPVDLGFLRFLVATPFMVLILLLSKKETRLPAKELLSLSVLGLTGVTLLYIFQFIGIEYTTASTSAVLINTNVIFIVLLSATFLKEKFPLRKSAGIALSFVGILVVIFAQMTNESIAFSNVFLIGCIFIILSAFCWATYSIVGKRLLDKYDPFTVTTYAFVLGTIFFLPVVLPNITDVIQGVSFNGWMAILYLALICSVFGYVAWYYALSRIEAGRAAVFLNLIPLFTIVISFFTGEIPTFIFLIGAILIIYGVYQAQK
ncbi:MAG: DMT family transporter [Thermoplasmatales archaeon]|nr:DMT family transporter [Thermoplasmatales archaeon]